MHRKLFIPGPSEVSEENLQYLATPQVGHRGVRAIHATGLGPSTSAAATIVATTVVTATVVVATRFW